jgi:hypothetical protein
MNYYIQSRINYIIIVFLVYQGGDFVSELLSKIQEDINSYKIELNVIEHCVKRNINRAQNKFRGKSVKTIEDTRYILSKARDEIGFIRMFNILNKNINTTLKENMESLEIDCKELDYVPYNILERELGLIEQYCQIDILEHIKDYGSIYEKINISISFDNIIDNFIIKVEEYTNIYIKHINKYLEEQEQNINKLKLAQSF